MHFVITSYFFNFVLPYNRHRSIMHAGPLLLAFKRIITERVFASGI